jgi:hypothetical protein
MLTITDKQGNTHTATFHSSINTLPIKQYQLAEKFSLIDIGVGDSIHDVNRHLSRFDQFLSANDIDSMIVERQNLQLNFSFLLEGQTIPLYILVCFLKTFDGEPVDITNDDDVDQYYAIFETSDITYGVVKELVDSQKKSLVVN